MGELQGMQVWLHANTSLRPFFLPEELSGETQAVPYAVDILTRLAEYFRVNVLPNAGEAWRAELPAIPHSLAEIKKLLRCRHRDDELSMIRRLAEHASPAALVIRHLGVTRPTVEEALKILREERRVQVNLLRILSSTRFRVLTKGKLYHACFAKDSLRHLPQCYELEPWVEFGPDRIHLLVLMARASLAPRDRQMLPYLQVFAPDMTRAEKVRM